MRLELISDNNLREAVLDLPSTGDVLLRSQGGPETAARSGDSGRTQIVTTYWVTLIPLRAGDLELPPIRVSGTHAGQQSAGQPFEAQTRRPIQLHVRPAVNSVRPWLPVKALTLNAQVEREERLEASAPVTLGIEITAIGATAEQLPNLEPALAGPGFRLYREDTLTETVRSRDGGDLLARRTDYFTLVPQASGRITLPEVSVDWWNVERGVREVASLPMRTLNSRGRLLDPGAVSGGRAWWTQIWPPFIGLLLVLGGYWAGVLMARNARHRAPHPADQPRRSVRPGGRLARQWRARARLARRRLVPVLGPRALGRALQGAVARLQPAGSRFVSAIRYANRAQDPLEWQSRLRGFGIARGNRKRANWAGLEPEAVLALRPGADPATLTRLLSELDAAVYGNRPLDFARWKRDFMRQVAGDATRWLKPKAHQTASPRGWSRRRLPPLNPRPD